MNRNPNPFLDPPEGKTTEDGIFSEAEVRLANRNSGILLEALALDVTPTGLHYLLNHFDVPLLDAADHGLSFEGAFESPFSLTMQEVMSLPQVTRPVTLECAGNGRAGVSPRPHSMPWAYEAVGTSEWTGTLLAPLLKRARLKTDVVEIAFLGADFGFDHGRGHYYGRSLTLDQIASSDAMLVHSMNGQPLLPQHGAPLRLIMPGWYGMASVKWLRKIEALTQPFDGFQQVNNYIFRERPEDRGRPVTALRVKSLMVPPGVPDWGTRWRLVEPGHTRLAGRAWSGNGVPIVKVEVAVDGVWAPAVLAPHTERYAWRKWNFDWDAVPGWHVLNCRATDADGNVQPLKAVRDVAGFGNNAVQRIDVFVHDTN